MLRKVECEGHLVDMCISSEFVQDALDMGGSCGPCPSSTEDDLAKLEACPDDPPIENNAVSCNVSLFICSLFFSRTMKLVAPAVLSLPIHDVLYLYVSHPFVLH